MSTPTEDGNCYEESANVLIDHYHKSVTNAVLVHAVNRLFFIAVSSQGYPARKLQLQPVSVLGELAS